MRKALSLHSFLIIALLCMAFIFESCSTKKNTFTRRTYHNLTSRYNAYFNGKESLKDGIKSLEKNTPDDFSKILPVYKYGKKESASSIFPQMDRAIEKASKVVSKHSIFVKGKEHCRWIDDAYLLMALANFYKWEHYTAVEILRFIPIRFKDSPLRPEATLWLARTNIQMERYEQALSMLNSLDEPRLKNITPKNLRPEIEATRAWYHVEKGEYPEAIPPLLKALSQTKKKKDKMRLTYILAQLYQQVGEKRQASDLYAKVLKLNPPYEFAFNAKINRPMLFSTNKQDGEAIKKELAKMINDRKNSDFLDQIYYALATIALAENQKPLALEYLKLSASHSVSNNTQKAKSFLKLGELYFEKPDYDSAYVYYDSTMAFLPKDFENYDKIKSLRNTLASIATNTRTVLHEDSLQRLAAMSPQQRDAVINKIIQDIVKEEQRIRQQEQLQQLAAMQSMGQNTMLTNTMAAGNQWYFYNPTAITFGKTEFNKRWGDRKLEDNWRRSNKEVLFAFGEGDMEMDTADGTSGGVADIKDKNFYLKNIPLTDEDMAKSHNKIMNALYNLGIIYKDELKSNTLSADAFEELFRRYPDNEHEVKAAFFAHRVYSDLGNSSRAEYYKNIVLTKYPDSDYAKLIIDPMAFAGSDKIMSEAELFYKSTWTAYNEGNYKTVFSNKTKADSVYAGNEIIPKFHFLSALATGKTSGRENLIASLNSVATQFAEYESGIQAREMLKILDPTSMLADTNNIIPYDPSGLGTQTPALPAYEYDKDDFHFFAIIASIMDNDINKLKISISDFNSKFFSQDKLMVNSVYLDNTRQVITISKFDGSGKATTYMNAFKKNSNLKNEIKGDAAQIIISASNYTKFYKSKDIEGYLNFFVENYK